MASLRLVGSRVQHRASGGEVVVDECLPSLLRVVPLSAIVVVQVELSAYGIAHVAGLS